MSFQDGKKLLEQEEKTSFISTLHKVLGPFMLRRLKKDVNLNLVPKKEAIVYCPLSDMQKKLYSYVIDKNIAALSTIDGEKDANVSSFMKCYKQPVGYFIFFEDIDSIYCC